MDKRGERTNTREGQKSLAEILNEIEQRANAATPGSWAVVPYRNSLNLSVVSEAQGVANICDINVVRSAYKANTSLIASARQDVPALVKALRVALDYAQSSMMEREVSAILSGTDGKGMEAPGKP